MIGSTLADIRDRIEAIASEDGDYYLVCGRHGDRPVPAASLRFESRPLARAAARATEQYRTALRRYDPQLPSYDVIVCQVPPITEPTERDDGQSEERRDELHSTVDTGGSPDGRQSLIEYCHTVAGAIFETVAESPHDDVEGAIMDTYLDRAETIDCPDELCLRLLESMATELDQRLSPEEQARVLVAAASRLSPPQAAENPLDATLAHLCSVAITSDYTLAPRSTALEPGTRSWDVTLSGYAVTRSGDRLATLPLVLELLRRHPDPALTISRATRLDTGAATSTWRFRLTTASDSAPTGLVSVPEVSTS